MSTGPGLGYHIVDSGGSALPGSLQTNRRLSQWLRFRPDGIVEVSSGKVEIGQGILTAVAQIVADELDVDLARIRMVPATTAASPNEGVTSGSLSVEQSGSALRWASAEARAIFLDAAAQRLGVDAQSLEVRDGEIAGPGNLRTSYWELAEHETGGGLLDRDATARIAPKPATARRLAGVAAERLDIPDKVFGRPRFIHDLALPGLLHSRVLRPPSPGATLAALDETKAKAVPGVAAVVRDGSFAGVVAETEDAAVAGLKALAASATWQPGEPLPDEGDLAAWIRSQPVETTPINTREAAAPGRVAGTVRRTYTRPFIAHASMAPSCAIAQWADGGVRIWTHTQGIYNLRADLELIFALPPDKIVVEHAEGSGCYGQNGADDVALEAALLARAAAGRPVRLLWSREDELAWSPMGAAQLVELEADLDEKGEIVGWRHDVWGNGHVSRPGRCKSPTLQAAWLLAQPFPRLVAEESAAASKANGGLIGPIHVDELAPQFQQLLGKLKVGELADVIRTTRGYQILKLESRTEVKGRTFEEARNDIGRRVIDGKGRAAMQKYLDDLRAQADIKWRNDELKRAYDQALVKRRQQTGAAPAPAA